MLMFEIFVLRNFLMIPKGNGKNIKYAVCSNLKTMNFGDVFRGYRKGAPA